MTVPCLKLDARCQRLIAEAVDRHGSIKAVAAQLGYSRTALSLAISGGYRAHSLKPLETKIVDTFATRVVCPHLNREIAPADCRDHRERPIPTADPRALRHWQACRFCPENPHAHRSVRSHAPSVKRQAADGDPGNPVSRGHDLSHTPTPSHRVKGKKAC